MTDLKTPVQAELGYGYGDIDQETQLGPGVWLKVPHRGHLRCILMRELPFRYWAHWVRRCYLPCPGRAKCDWCALAIGAKPRYVFSLWDVERKRSGLLEVGPDTAGQVRDACTTHGFEPGLCIKLSKAGGTVNGAIKVDVLHDIYRLADLPPGPDPEDVLKRQWSQPTEERG